MRRPPLNATKRFGRAAHRRPYTDNDRTHTSIAALHFQTAGCDPKPLKRVPARSVRRLEVSGFCVQAAKKARPPVSFTNGYWTTFREENQERDLLRWDSPTPYLHGQNLRCHCGCARSMKGYGGIPPRCHGER